jgi:hypothetical protein
MPTSRGTLAASQSRTRTISSNKSRRRPRCEASSPPSARVAALSSSAAPSRAPPDEEPLRLFRPAGPRAPCARAADRRRATRGSVRRRGLNSEQPEQPEQQMLGAKVVLVQARASSCAHESAPRPSTAKGTKRFRSPASRLSPRRVRPPTSPFRPPVLVPVPRPSTIWCIRGWLTRRPSAISRIEAPAPCKPPHRMMMIGTRALRLALELE